MKKSNGIAETVRRSHALVPQASGSWSFDVKIEEPSNLGSDEDFYLLKGKNPTFVECIQTAKIASMTASNVLVTGDTGTGKELLARSIHNASSRRHCAFVPIDCAAIPKELIASELFGYEEGSFTGARKCGKMGKFEVAHGGTLFLDEVAEMPVELQACLLRAIEEKEIYRLGGTEPIRLDVRLIASTNRELRREIGFGGIFRRDLYYRLSVFHINLPRLADRMDDIPLLADHFLNNLAFNNAYTKVFAEETVDILMRYPWPGNIRELANLIERAFYISMKERTIRPEDLPLHVSLFQAEPKQGDVHTVSPGSPQSENSNSCFNELLFSRALEGRPISFAIRDEDQPATTIKENEKQLIQKMLYRCGYNISRTAQMLGISRSTLYLKLKKYDIDRAFRL